MWWQWLIFGFIFLAIPFGLFKIKEYTAKRINPTEKQKKIANQRFTILCLFYWLCDFFYMTFIMDNLAWKFILGGLIMIIIFYNLSKAFINGNRIFNFGLIQDFVVGIALTVYLIYIIPNQDLQNIIIPIISAVYGGLLTLVGVAWTIRKSDVDKQKEEEKKAKPLFTYIQIFKAPKLKDVSKSCIPEDLEKEYFCDIYFELENSNRSAFTIKRIKHDNKWFEMENNIVVLPSDKILMSFRFNDPFNIFMEVEDSLQKYYYYRISVLSLNKTAEDNVHFLHTIRGLKEVSAEEANKIQKDKGEKHE